MITLAIALGVVVLIEPPQPRPCELGGFLVEVADGNKFRAVAAEVMPAEVGVSVTPESPGRIHCDGFERP